MLGQQQHDTAIAAAKGALTVSIYDRVHLYYYGSSHNPADRTVRPVEIDGGLYAGWRGGAGCVSVSYFHSLRGTVYLKPPPPLSTLAVVPQYEQQEDLSEQPSSILCTRIVF